jgi:hypothetical protein
MAQGLPTRVLQKTRVPKNVRGSAKNRGIKNKQFETQRKIPKSLKISSSSSTVVTSVSDILTCNTSLNTRKLGNNFSVFFSKYKLTYTQQPFRHKI